MGKSWCRRCAMVTHIEDGEWPWEDRCWACGALIPFGPRDAMLTLLALLDGEGLYREPWRLAALTLPG